MCLLISSFRQRNWTAVKITPHPHSLDPNQALAMVEETDRSGGTDTSKFLCAGASRALLCETRDLRQSVPILQREWTAAENVIVESNSLVEFLLPDLYLAVVNRSPEEWKASAKRFFPRAHALVCWDEEPQFELPTALADKPMFVLPRDTEKLLRLAQSVFAPEN